MVQYVHHFETDLDFTILVHGEMLEQRCIRAPITGTPQCIPWEIAERAFCRSAKRTVGRTDGCSIEPLVSRLRTVWIADQVRPVRARVAVCTGVSIRDLERKPTLDDHVGVELPSADERIGHR